MTDLSALRTVVADAYHPDEYPALTRQVHAWQGSRPLDGVRIVDASPVFRNTLTKYLPLLTGGAHLTVALSPLLPHDPAAVEILDDVGVPVIGAEQTTGFDVVIDCAGVLAACPSRFGYVELMKSGEHVYAGCAQPVFLVDDSEVKLIETVLGTGDGFLRGLAHFGYGDVAGHHIVVFGGGKVGRGAALAARAAGAHVTVVDPDPIVEAPPGCELLRHPGGLQDVWCVVSATGVAGALAPLTDVLRESGAVLANLGAEDEFGPAMPTQRVLNAKAPVNFALTEPTRLRYIDPTMALDNACAVELLRGGYPAGLNRPPQHLEDEILQIWNSTDSRTVDG